MRTRTLSIILPRNCARRTKACNPIKNAPQGFVYLFQENKYFQNPVENILEKLYNGSILILKRGSVKWQIAIQNLRYLLIPLSY